jgi:DNA mismatch repair protein MutS2
MNRRKAQEDNESAARLKKELSDLRHQLESDRIKLKENKKRIMDEATREAKIIVMDAKEEANRIIRELEKMRQSGISAMDNNKTQKMRDDLKKKEESIDKKMKNASKPKRTFVDPPKDLKPGTSVKIVDMNQEATVLKEPDKNGIVRVQAGIIKMDVHITNLKKTEKSDSKELADKYMKSVRSFSSKTKTTSTELDVRGQNLEEAIDNVSKYLDDCYLASVSTVTIIHGKGTGILRKGIQEYLRKNKRVKEYRNGRYGEGEDGVTVVEL